MKNLFSKLYYSLILVAMPMVAFAADDPTCNDPSLTSVKSKFAVHYCSVNSVVIQVITILLSVLAVISALMIVIGGYRYVMSAGNPEGAKKGRQTITYAIIGLVVSVLAYTLIAIVNNTITR